MPSVFVPSNFAVDTLSFGKHKPNTNNGYNIDIIIGNSTEETLIQTPKMRTPFGISTDKTNPFKKSLDISFQNEDSNESIKAFRKLVQKIDTLAIDYAMKNCKTFFKKDLSREVVTEYYFSAIKPSKKAEYSDTFRFKLPFLKPNPEKNMPDGKFITDFWDTEGNQKDYQFLDKGDHVISLIKPKQLWTGSKGFGVTWECTQVRVYKQKKTSGYAAFVKTNDSDSDSVEEVEVEESEEEVEVDA